MSVGVGPRAWVVILWDGWQVGRVPLAQYWSTDWFDELPVVKTMEEARCEVELRLLGAWA